MAYAFDKEKEGFEARLQTLRTQRGLPYHNQLSSVVNDPPSDAEVTDVVLPVLKWTT